MAIKRISQFHVKLEYPSSHFGKTDVSIIGYELPEKYSGTFNSVVAAADYLGKQGRFDIFQNLRIDVYESLKLDHAPAYADTSNIVNGKNVILFDCSLIKSEDIRHVAKMIIHELRHLEDYTIKTAKKLSAKKAGSRLIGKAESAKELRERMKKSWLARTVSRIKGVNLEKLSDTELFLRARSRLFILNNELRDEGIAVYFTNPENFFVDDFKQLVRELRGIAGGLERFRRTKNMNSMRAILRDLIKYFTDEMGSWAPFMVIPILIAKKKQFDPELYNMTPIQFIRAHEKSFRDERVQKHLGKQPLYSYNSGEGIIDYSAILKILNEKAKELGISLKSVK